MIIKKFRRVNKKLDNANLHLYSGINNLLVWIVGTIANKDETYEIRSVVIV